ncbi:MAG TPA: hypothetical protein VIM58_03920, partial [Candidatus Methylacidiphilales bacterium]
MSLLRAAFRSRANYILALGTEAAAPLLRGFARIVSPPPLPPPSWRRGVLLGADHIGDILFRSASLPLLARVLPECSWSWLCGPPADAIVEADPLVAGGVVRLPDGMAGTPFL